MNSWTVHRPSWLNYTFPVKSSLVQIDYVRRSQSHSRLERWRSRSRLGMKSERLGLVSVLDWRVLRASLIARKNFLPLLTILRITDVIDVASFVSMFIISLIIFFYVAVHICTNAVMNKRTYVGVWSLVCSGTQECNEFVASFVHNKTAYCKQTSSFTSI